MTSSFTRVLMAPSHGEAVAYGVGGLLCPCEQRPEAFSHGFECPRVFLYDMQRNQVLQHPGVNRAGAFLPLKLKGQRVCTFLRGWLWEHEEAVPHPPPSPRRQRTMSSCPVDTITNVMSCGKPACFLVNSHTTAPRPSTHSRLPSWLASCPRRRCALSWIPVVTSSPRSLQGYHVWKQPRMLPSVFPYSLQVDVTDCPVLVAPGLLLSTGLIQDKE